VIIAGSMTLLEHIPYTCVKIEGNTAFLKRVGDEKRGRFKKMDVRLVPFVNEKNELIVPKPLPVNRKRMTRFHFMKIIKEEVELPLSHDLAYFVAEWLETLVSNAAYEAERNAKQRGDSRIVASHWPPKTDLGNQLGYWPENREYAKDYKEYLSMEQTKGVEIEDV